MSNERRLTPHPSREGLLRMLSLDDSAELAAPDPESLEEAFRQLMDKPLLFDCDAPASDPVPRTLGEMFESGRPPIGGLRAAKEFAKTNLQGFAGTQLNRETAALIYYLAIAIARVRLHSNLSGLDEEALRNGWRWAGSRSWINEEHREIFQKALLAGKEE